MNVSSITASNILTKNIAKVSKSTICELLKKGTIILDKDTITKVCIDDFAIKKRHTYGSIMIDIDTHRIVNLIVTKWLKTYKNLKVVSRDDSITYKNTISKAHPSANQVSDRFYLLKNLTEYCEEYLKRKFNSNLTIQEKGLKSSLSPLDISKLSNNHLTLEKKWEKQKSY